MESKLVVKNFGPIKHVELDLRNVNVFIGPQATGKSALAKIYTIFKAPKKFLFKSDSERSDLDKDKNRREFKEALEEYNIGSFLNDKTEIYFDSLLHTISYKETQINYVPKLLNKITSLESLSNEFKANRSDIINGFLKLADDFIYFSMKAARSLAREGNAEMFLENTHFDSLNEESCKLLFDIIRTTENDLSANTALYIPSERNFINIIKKSALNLILNKVPIPKHILSFGAELEKLNLSEINLGFIQKNLIYKIVNGEDRIYFNENESIMLNEAASGIQSVVPILAPILSQQYDGHRSFVIEEPELNLFPVAQYELIQRLESNRRDPHWEDFGTIHTYTTHSPYILSALNNLLYANKVRLILDAQNPEENSVEKDNRNKAIVRNIVGAEIRPYFFSAYQISDGLAKSIFNRTEGLIEGNYIDEASDKISDDFDALMELTR